MAWTETRHPNIEAMVDALSNRLASAIGGGLAARGRAVLALAGGRTPFPVYRRIAEAPLDWARVTVLPTDERWVQAEHPASNLREMRSAFAAARGLRLVSLTPVEPSTRPSADFAQVALTDVAGPFDAVLLGMGGDGHFASLFPGSAELDAGLRGEADALVVHPEPLPPEAPFARISLSASRLLNTRRLLLAITGEAKRAVLQRAQAQDDARALPICAMLHQSHVPLEIHWSP